MNERIRQLAEEATSIVEMVSSYGYMSSYANFDREKFAELIIKECMSCAQFVGITNDRIGLGPMPIKYTSMVNDKIRKRFGIKE